MQTIPELKLEAAIKNVDVACPTDRLRLYFYILAEVSIDNETHDYEGIVAAAVKDMNIALN